MCGGRISRDFLHCLSEVAQSDKRSQVVHLCRKFGIDYVSILICQPTVSVRELYELDIVDVIMVLCSSLYNKLEA